ncbi:MAG TPA: Abi-alpha family protein [Jatrophihabitantaceae bacterium]|nr:Abi-alpha family protein [Jatrophihabitantaceae bacterium]
MTDPTDRPRPTPDGSAREDAETDPVDLSDPDEAAASVEPVPVRNVVPPPPIGPLTRVEIQPSQVVAAAGTAIVTAARVGRLLSRSGWRIARQLPGAKTVEREAQRLQALAANEARRILQLPQSAGGGGRTTAEEQRAVNYIRNADPGTAPLRSAMSELLERSVEATRTDSREYLFGTIISQLVPDEARILAAMSDGTTFAAADVVVKPRRGAQRTILANVSSVGRQAGLVSPDNVPTYLGRLHNFGLITFDEEDEDLGVQYDILATDQTVQNARHSVDARRRGTVKLERKTVGMSQFGQEFWTASDPSRPVRSE